MYLDAEFSQPTSEPPAESTALGDWYANLFSYDSVDIAMCVNQKTRYAIPVPLYDCKTDHELYVALCRRIGGMIRNLGFPSSVATQVDQEYTGIMVAPTADRSVIGTMNDLIHLCEYMLDEECDSGRPFDFNMVWHKLEDQLNQTPHKPIGYDNSRERMIELLQSIKRI